MNFDGTPLAQHSPSKQLINISAANIILHLSGLIWKVVWRSEALPKITFFIWTLLKDKILTSESLKKRGVLGPSRCPNCQTAEETAQHLFIGCPLQPVAGMSSILIFSPAGRNIAPLQRSYTLGKAATPREKRRITFRREFGTPFPM